VKEHKYMLRKYRGSNISKTNDIIQELALWQLYTTSTGFEKEKVC
jgi:hypothetical protein